VDRRKALDLMEKERIIAPKLNPPESIYRIFIYRRKRNQRE